MFKDFRLSRGMLAAAPVFALLVSLAPSAVAQDSTTAAQPTTRTTQTQQQTPTPVQTPVQTDASAKTAAQVASTPSGETVAAKAVVEPLYREYRGVKLGMSADEVRSKLGKPETKSDEMDFFVLSGHERARVYYRDKKASAVIATYIGKDAGTPAPTVVLGTDVEAKPDGSMYMMTPYKHAGYWVAYSRTPGDAPLVIITMQKTP